jgi:PD-(D/E)XK endonuclease
MAFLHKASSLGVGVAKPFGDNERYDFILDSGERLWRVQVKSTCLERGGGYRTWGRGSNEKPYKASEIDFLVAYIIPRNIWYVIPADLVTTSSWLGLFPSGCKHNAGYFESYREAWHLMASGGDSTPPTGVLRRVHAMACQQSSGSSIGRDIEDIPRYPRYPRATLTLTRHAPRLGMFRSIEHWRDVEL